MLVVCVLCRSVSEQHPLFCNSCLKDIGLHLVSRNNEGLSIGELKLSYIGLYQGRWADWIKVAKSKSPISIEKGEIDFLESVVEHYSVFLELEKFDYVIPVPGHPLRLMNETNLALLFGKMVSKLSQKPLLNILKQRKTLSNLLGLSQKEKNFKERCALEPGKKFSLQEWGRLQGRVLLIDDVCTTGATLQAAKTMLNRSGLKVYGAMVLALAPSLSTYEGRGASFRYLI